MRFGRLAHALIVAAFLAGQWLALLHATQHELKPERTVACELCTLAHAAGAPPAAIELAAALIPRGAQPVCRSLPCRPRRPLTRPNSRGPPLFLA
jgi:hypothetical protein